jgi:hypothetical protein
MSETVETKEKPEKVEKKEDKWPQGPRGEVGEASAGLRIRQMWHEAHFKRVASESGNPRKRVYVPMAKAPSLKQFARQLAASGDAVAKEWLAHKKGSLNKERTPENTARIALEKQATMAARKKTKK